MRRMSEPWWKSAVVYQIYPRSFSQSPGGAEARRQRYADLPENYPTSPLVDTKHDNG